MSSENETTGTANVDIADEYWQQLFQQIESADNYAIDNGKLEILMTIIKKLYTTFIE